MIEEFVNLATHAFLLFSILSILFLAVISKIERSALRDQIQAFAKTLDLSSIKDNFPPDISKKVFDLIDTPEESTVVGNTWIRNTLILISAFLLVLISLPYFLNISVPYKSIFINNLILFVLIGAFEIVFFLRYIRYFVPLQANELKQMLITILQNELYPSTNAQAK
jgi:hypothetical protein